MLGHQTNSWSIELYLSRLPQSWWVAVDLHGSTCMQCLLWRGACGSVRAEHGALEGGLSINSGCAAVEVFLKQVTPVCMKYSMGYGLVVQGFWSWDQCRAQPGL